MKKITSIACGLMLLSVAIGVAAETDSGQTIAEACELKPSVEQCASTEHFLSAPALFKDDFEKYKLCAEAKFDLYNIEKNCEFEAYTARAQKAFDDYKSKVATVWDKPAFSDNNTWISYSPSMQMKREVDFEKNVIKVEKIEDEDGTVTVNEMKEEITAITKVTVGEAQQAEPYTAELIKAAKPEKLSAEPLLPVAKEKPAQSSDLDELLKHAEVTTRINSNGKKVMQIKATFPASWTKRKEQRFSQSVDAYADKYGLTPEFILSIIKTESAFDPRAVSHIPAFGLMQIVPNSAGLDATNYVFGKERMLDKTYLFNPEQNIEIGSAYLHLLKTRYFKGVEHPESLKYCMIAAYNGGMRPIYKIFGKGNRSRAIAAINQLSPEEVYNTIIDKHYAAETRNYLKKVHRAEQSYINNAI